MIGTFSVKLVNMEDGDTLNTVPEFGSEIHLNMDFEEKRILLVKLPETFRLFGVESVSDGIPEPLDIMNRDKFFLRVHTMATPEKLFHYTMIAESLIYHEFDYALTIDEHLTKNASEIILKFKCSQFNGEFVYFTVTITE